MSSKMMIVGLGLSWLMAGCTPRPEDTSAAPAAQEARKEAAKDAVASGTPAPVQGEGPAAAEAGDTPTVKATP